MAACRRCNGERGHRTPAEWIEECQRRGWEPAIATVIGVFEEFQTKVAREGRRTTSPGRTWTVSCGGCATCGVG